MFTSLPHKILNFYPILMLVPSKFQEFAEVFEFMKKNVLICLFPNSKPKHVNFGLKIRYFCKKKWFFTFLATIFTHFLQFVPNLKNLTKTLQNDAKIIKIRAKLVFL